MIDFLKKHPLITGLAGVLFTGLSARYLGPRMVGNLEAGVFRLALALSAAVFLYLISGEKAFEKSNNKTGYAILVLLPTLLFPFVAFVVLIIRGITAKSALAENWPLNILILAFGFLCAGLLEEVTSRGIINDSILYRFRNSKISTRNLFITIAVTDVLVFGAIHIIGSDLSTPLAIGLGILKTLGSGIGALPYLLMYWKTRNLWAIAIMHGLYDFLLKFGSELFRQADSKVSNTQDYAGVTGSDVPAIIILQLILIVIDIVICIWIWKKHMKDVDFENIRRTW